MRLVAVTRNSAKFEIEIEKCFPKAASRLSIADDESFERLERVDGAKDTAVSPAPRLVKISMPFNTVEWHRLIGALAAGNSLGSNVEYVISACPL